MSDINNPEVSLASLRITAQEMRDRQAIAAKKPKEEQLERIYTDLRSATPDANHIRIDPPSYEVRKALDNDGYVVVPPYPIEPNRKWRLYWSKKR